MIKCFRITCNVVVIIVLAGLFYLNLGLYYKPAYIPEGRSLVSADVLAQLRFLKTAMRNGAAEDMQRLFPEGYVFLNALYGLTWCDVAQDVDRHSSLYSEAHAEVQFAYDRINSEEGRDIFSEYQQLPYGAFYNGWSNYLLACKLGIEPAAGRNAREVAEFATRCSAIAAALHSSRSPYLSSYPGAAWPADVVLCVASLTRHDGMFQPRYKQAVKGWLGQVKTRLDEHGLLPHAVVVDGGAVAEGARGSSLSLMLCFLPEIDKNFAREQFAAYRILFLDHRLGLTGVREYPVGSFGMGDVDSGPVLLQIGSAASIVGMRAFRVNGDVPVSMELRNGLEAFALPWRSGDVKKYFLGQMPMADAFLTWAQSAGTADDRLANNVWRNTFHVYSSVIALALAGGWVYLNRRRRRRDSLTIEHGVNRL